MVPHGQNSDNPSSSAATAYADFLRRREQGEDLDFDALCAQRPEIADALRILHELKGQPDETASVPDAGGHGVSSENIVDGGVPSPGAHPDRIGPYKILGVLGEGGMGIVYLAEQKEPIRRRVALKCMTRTDHKEFLARFEAERQALAMMNHPNIARVHDAGATEDGKPYFAMEHVQGVPITEYCNRHKLSIPERLQLFRQICQGIEHAHHRGIIHRDIKPSNVLVTTQDKDAVAKIIDFGVAKATSQRLTERTLYTEVGRVIGTPQYMSPEQAETTGEDVDHRTDIYSLGVLLYELLVGELPLEVDFHTLALEEALRRIREEEPPTPSMRLSRLNPAVLTQLAGRRDTTRLGLERTVRGDLGWITMKALAKERRRRYWSAAEFRADIERYLAGESIHARPPSVSYRLRTFVRRNRWPVAVVAAVVLSLLVGLIVSIGFYRRLEQTAEENRRLAHIADVKRVAYLKVRAEELWPSLPRTIPGLEAWLQEAEAVSRRLREYEPRAAFGASKGDEDDELLEHALALRELVGQPPERGLIEAVRERREFAQSVERRSIEEHRDDWKKAIASIGNRDESPGYDGLELPPQVGLVPIGRDPDSGLREFAHLATGEVPERGLDGRLAIDEGTGLVFVLIPGGRARIGAVKPSPEVPEGAPRVDPGALALEGPVHDVPLDPYFISKFELTQSQWLRVTGESPSFYPPQPPVPPGGEPDPWGQRTLLHPVEWVSWEQCRNVLARLDLLIPTEAQWEHAARGGTPTVFWTGNDKESLRGAVNIADLSAMRAQKATGSTLSQAFFLMLSGYDDGFAAHAPVNTLRANDFGLHHVLGNVLEWCRDGFGAYDLPVAPGDGERLGGDPRKRVFRGGGFSYPYRSGRSAGPRLYYRPNFVYSNLGVRPARAVQR